MENDDADGWIEMTAAPNQVEGYAVCYGAQHPDPVFSFVLDMYTYPFFNLLSQWLQWRHVPMLPQPPAPMADVVRLSVVQARPLSPVLSVDLLPDCAAWIESLTPIVSQAQQQQQQQNPTPLIFGGMMSLFQA